MIPFDLERALAGARVVTKGGRIASSVRLIEDSQEEDNLLVVIGGHPTWYYSNGKYRIDGHESSDDLVMFSEEVSYEALKQVQLSEWPDSVIIPERDALKWMYELANHSDRNMEYQRDVARWLAIAMQHSNRLFYYCGLRDDGDYEWRAMRYGIDPVEYIGSCPQARNY